jgi:transcriptional regulator with XRE-family HTH domain
MISQGLIVIDSVIFRGSCQKMIASPFTVVTYGTMKLIEKVSKILGQRGLKQADLAEMIQVTPQRVSHWFNGTGQPKPDQLLRIARALDVSMEFLADDGLAESPPQEFTEDERYILRVVRSLAIDADTAVQRLTMSPLAKPIGPTYDDGKQKRERTKDRERGA